MSNAKPGLLGRKLGMTQIYSKEGEVLPVTIVDVSGNAVLRVKTADSKDGYDAVQLGFGTRKPSRTNKPMQGEFEKAGVSPRQHVRELRLGADALGQYPAGQEVAASAIFAEGELVDVVGTSKGSGFTGVMKKYHFAGFESSHGAHEYYRHGGSIGTRLTPGHVLKGKKMPGQHGNAQITVQNMELLKLDAERNLLYIKGGVPGPTGGIVVVRKAVKGGN